jgi:D-lactate dehydrogenase
MKVAIFSTKPYDRRVLNRANGDGKHELSFLDAPLNRETVGLAEGFDTICCFVHDTLDAGVLIQLKKRGITNIALRCAGFNNVDLDAAKQLDLTVVRVPAYSPSAVAEHTIALMMTLNRKIHRAHARVRENNFALDGLLGFEVAHKTVGVVGTGKIGEATAKILAGFGAKLIGYDVYESDEFKQLGGAYVELPELLKQADIITLHVPLTPETRHMINRESLTTMKRGVMLINTSRGDLIDTRAAIEALKSGRIGHLGLDVYEEEDKFFFQDFSGEVLQDDTFARLLTFPNVLITSHQAFFTEEALDAIAATTIANFDGLENGDLPEANLVVAEQERHVAAPSPEDKEGD